MIRLGTSTLPMLISAPYPPELGMCLDLVKASAWAFPSHPKHSRSEEQGSFLPLARGCPKYEMQPTDLAQVRNGFCSSSTQPTGSFQVFFFLKKKVTRSDYSLEKLSSFRTQFPRLPKSNKALKHSFSPRVSLQALILRFIAKKHTKSNNRDSTLS